MTCGPVPASAAPHQASEAFEAFEAFAGTGASVGSLAETGIEASEASATSGAFQGTAASGMERRAADLEAMSLLVHPVENSIEANEAGLEMRVS